MQRQLKRNFIGTLAVTLCALAAPAQAQNKVLNLYSARHYQTDEALYSNFEKQTGIKINRIEASDEALIERIKSEGKYSPADVILLVDAARVWKVQSEGLLAPVKSSALEQRIPAELRAKDEGQGSEWFAFSIRARAIFYNKIKVKPQDIADYQDLADPKFKGKVCTRSGAHPYMLSLWSSLINHLGETQAEQVIKGIKDNLARDPKGGDTDQLKAVAAGECTVALSNTYYWVRLLRSDKPEDIAIVNKVGMIWPNQKTTGAHINISAGGMLKNAPNKEAAIQFLEYLASDQAQAYFANGNNEWPAVKTVTIKNPELESLGKFKSDPLATQAIAARTVIAQKILDRVGYK